jgi:hypothetical protein
MGIVEVFFFSKFGENRFLLNELFTVSSTLLIFSSKPLKLEWLNKILVSSANNTGTALLSYYLRQIIHIYEKKQGSQNGALCNAMFNLSPIAKR